MTSNAIITVLNAIFLNNRKIFLNIFSASSYFILFIGLSSFTLTGCSNDATVALPNINPKHSIIIKTVPDFSSIKDTKTKKTQFFNFLLPIALEENKIIQNHRKVMLRLQKKSKNGLTLTQNEKEWLDKLATKYNIKFDPNNVKFWELMNRRVDIIPVSLLLAQGAIESAWGTSRFAQKANNLFGQWCYKKGCGLVPSRRNAGDVHEVKKFKTVNAAVRTYMTNLNKNDAYKALRIAREQVRKQNKKLTGIAISSGLTKYSARGNSYVNEINSVILTNKLYIYDTAQRNNHAKHP